MTEVGFCYACWPLRKKISPKTFKSMKMYAPTLEGSLYVSPEFPPALLTVNIANINLSIGPLYVVPP